MRRSSWELTAKCLGHAAVPVDCIPCTRAAPMVPARKGSSEKYSKLRPHRGERLMLSPGPRRTCTPRERASRPRACPIRRASSGFQVAARAEAVGKHVAFSEAAMPRWSPSPSCRRTPWGPSLMTKDGTPALGICRESHWLAPDARASVTGVGVMGVNCLSLPRRLGRCFHCGQGTR